MIKAQESNEKYQMSWLINLKNTFDNDKDVYYHYEHARLNSKIGNWQIDKSLYECAVEYCKKQHLEDIEFTHDMSEIKTKSIREFKEIIEDDPNEHGNTGSSNSSINKYNSNLQIFQDSIEELKRENQEIKEMIRLLVQSVQKISNEKAHSTTC